MFHNPYDVMDFELDFDCWYDSTDAENLPEDRDCYGSWSEVFEVHEDFDKDPEGAWFVSNCPKCGREAQAYKQSARGYADSMR